MRRAVLALAVLCVFAGCEQRTAAERTVANTAEPATRPAQIASLIPPQGATEVAPGVFVLTVFRRPSPGKQIESMTEVQFIETMYDDAGREVATSVPSSTWSLLPETQRVILVGMRSGDRRRIWTCTASREAGCKVEDVQVFDRAESAARPNSPLQPTATAPPSS